MVFGYPDSDSKMAKNLGTSASEYSLASSVPSFRLIVLWFYNTVSIMVDKKNDSLTNKICSPIKQILLT